MKFSKIFVPILLVTMLALCLASCELRNEPTFEYDGEGFVSRVVKVEGNVLIVEPVSYEAPEARSGNRFSIQNHFATQIQKGDVIIIKHDGTILETYPASFGKIFEMTLVGDNGLNETVHFD